MGKVLSRFSNGFTGAVSRSIDNVIISMRNASGGEIPFGAPVFLTPGENACRTFSADTATAGMFLGFAVRAAVKAPDVYGSSEAAVACHVRRKSKGTVSARNEQFHAREGHARLLHGDLKAILPHLRVPSEAADFCSLEANATLLLILRIEVIAHDFEILPLLLREGSHADKHHDHWSEDCENE